ncbi:MAG TPA: GAF domain-containing protein [Candidatus Binatia bacterium]|jgi:GAF domain-containing protein
MEKAAPMALIPPQGGKVGAERQHATLALTRALWLRADARRAHISAEEAKLFSEGSRERLENLARRNGFHKILLTLAKSAVQPCDRRALLTDVLDAAIALTKADMGNIQLLNPAAHALAIEAQRELPPFFLDYFAYVRGGASACGAALEKRARVIVEDVARSPIFAGVESRHVVLAAGAAAVQSTPLVASSGRFLGVLSTHYRRPQRPGEDCLTLLDAVARRTADVLDKALL